MTLRLSALFPSLLDLVAPPRCAACDDPFPAGALCARCDEATAPAEEAPEAVRAVFLHGGPIAAAIHRAKYHADPTVARALGALLRPVPAPRDALIVPIPLHPRRFAARGFNQSAELARGWLGPRRVDHGVLARARDTPTQTALHRDARRENVRGAFVVPAPARVAGRAVVLVDDVVTTGATLAEAMACVRAGGASSVMGVALASAALRCRAVSEG
ncbi:MAG: phosphoribosyltransferase family protein [Polyangiales bacterium]